MNRASKLTINRRNYYELLGFVEALDEALTKGRIHLRDRRGRLLATLGEVVAAILEGDLA